MLYKNPYRDIKNIFKGFRGLKKKYLNKILVIFFKLHSASFNNLDGNLYS